MTKRKPKVAKGEHRDTTRAYLLVTGILTRQGAGEIALPESVTADLVEVAGILNDEDARTGTKDPSKR